MRCVWCVFVVYLLSILILVFVLILGVLCCAFKMGQMHAEYILLRICFIVHLTILPPFNVNFYLATRHLLIIYLLSYRHQTMPTKHLLTSTLHLYHHPRIRQLLWISKTQPNQSSSHLPPQILLLPLPPPPQTTLLTQYPYRNPSHPSKWKKVH